MRNITTRQQELLCLVCRLGAVCNVAHAANAHGVDVRAAYARLDVLERRRLLTAYRPGRAKAITVIPSGDFCQKCGCEHGFETPVTGRHSPKERFCEESHTK